MKKNILFINLFALSFTLSLSPGQLLAVETSQPSSSFSEQQKKQFIDELKEQIEIQKKDLLELEKKVTVGKQNFEGDLKKEFEGKISSFEVKNTLIKNFKNSESLKDPLVREKLKNIFEKPVLQEKDLEELQKLLDQEKSKGSY